jgi:anti-sigma factor RsiW
MKPIARPNDSPSCARARAELSARHDGELVPEAEAELERHLETCAACRAHARALIGLAREFELLCAAPEPVRDLWPALARRTRPPRLLVRVAAALVGFASLGAGAAWLEHVHATADEHARHLVERFGSDAGPSALFAALPEYRALRAFPPEEPR